MTHGDLGIDDKAMAFGLLMESAQAHQKLAESQLVKLQDHTRQLDGVVRGEIRRTLVDELQMLSVETARSVRELQKIRRGAGLRSTLGGVGLAIACGFAPILVARVALPSAEEISALKSRRDALALDIAKLERRGGRINLRECGDALRLCVQVDLKAPKFGEKADYFVAEGY